MSSNGNEPVDAAAMSAEADALYEKGVAAIKSGAMEEAIELLAKALELKTKAHGEEAVECAPAYYKYGCALFYKAQDENTVFGKQAQAQADAKDEAARKASGSGAADEGEACDDDDDAPEGDAAKDGDAEDEEEEEDDMELAWKLIENARLIYEEAEDHPIELANCFETLGEINTEHSNFKEALEDLERCLAILETELDDDDRRIAGVLCSMSVAHQMLDEYEKALKGCTRAIGVCRARVKRLKSSDQAAVDAVKASLAPGAAMPEDPLAAAKAELEQIEAVLGDLTAREEELRGLVSEDNDTREQIKKAFAAIGGASVGAGASAGAGGAAGAEESGGFAAPKLAAGAAAPVNLGVVGKSAGAARVSAAPVVGGGGSKEPKRVNLAPVSAAPAAAGSSAAAAAAAFAAMSGAPAPAPSAAPAPATGSDEPAAKKVKVVPVAAEPATAAAAPAEKENAPDGCKQQ